MAVSVDDIIITLSQARKPPLSFSIASASYLDGLRDDLDRGETLTLSYWSAPQMTWLDGGVCAHSRQGRTALLA